LAGPSSSLAVFGLLLVAEEKFREKQNRWMHRVRKKCELENDHERESLREHDGERSTHEREKE